ncbi:MAG: 3-dehydroquinate synthase [Candidatus Omnitrophica bacterium]|nr:3-dehydroquinate synthase [Candidatus Omnitrophota bacterium]
MKQESFSTLTVKTPRTKYPIHIGYNLANSLNSRIHSLNLGNHGVVLTSPKVAQLYNLKKMFGATCPDILRIADGEKAKSRRWVFRIIDELLAADTWNKKLYLVCVGGGTIGDLGGFIASVYKRGIPYVQVPTTLLAQIDASIGGKTAIDLPQAKNVIGTIYQPKAVFVDPDFLLTLEKRELLQGLAECIKYAVITAPRLFSLLEKNAEKILDLDPHLRKTIITRCAGIKTKIVSMDEDEKKGIRTLLNFGHTLGHALETSTGYRRALSHGEAVAIGMLYAAFLSHELGFCSHKSVARIRDLLLRFRLPVKIRGNQEKIFEAIRYDKKFISGKARMVLIRKIGNALVQDDIPLPVIKRALKNYCRFVDKT